MIDPDHPLLLGSASPRRRDILETLGLPLHVATKAVDESTRPGEDAEAYLERVVRAKLAATATLASRAFGAALVADTSVLVDGEILGKPADDDDARRVLRRLSGRSHAVWTRFALSAPEALAAAVHEETVRTTVTFRALSDEEIAGYVATGEQRDKAGAYAVQGIGAFAVARIEGSYANVVGLPACEVVSALLRTGLLARFPVAKGATRG
jgi:septum formation protein